MSSEDGWDRKDPTSKEPRWSGPLDSPPAYSRDERSLDNVGPSPADAEVEDEAYVLKHYDTVLVVDDSGSMQGPRWNQAREAISQLAAVASQHDEDGIDVYFLNEPSATAHNLRSRDQVIRLFNSFQPKGCTYIATLLAPIFEEYRTRLQNSKHTGERVKPVNYLVITDGQADDPDELKALIISLAKFLNEGSYPPSQVGIQFVQIGNDKKATKFLKELDDGLTKKCERDIVDTIYYSGEPLSSERLLKALLGGISRTKDKQPSRASRGASTGGRRGWTARLSQRCSSFFSG